MGGGLEIDLAFRKYPHLACLHKPLYVSIFLDVMRRGCIGGGCFLDPPLNYYTHILPSTSCMSLRLVIRFLF